MSNPVLNERTLEKWAAPEASQRAGVNDGPVSEWTPPPAPGESMTVKGSVSATAVLLVLLLISAAYGWYQTGSPSVDSQGVGMHGQICVNLPAHAAGIKEGGSNGRKHTCAGAFT